MKCKICSRQLNTTDPLSLDCGGDCVECMAIIGEDPDAIAYLNKLGVGKLNDQSSSILLQKV